MATSDAHTQPEFCHQTENTALTQFELSPTKTQMDADGETERNKGGRPRKTPNVVPWTVRGVDLETRTAIEKAASCNGKTIGQYMNEDLRHYAQEQIKKGNQPPMGQEDIRTELDDIKGMITQLSERIPTQEKRNFFQKIFS